jgi:ABC-type transport system involved in multi-copper enzyme maturation permease subunit
MSALVTGVRRRGGWIGGRVANFWSGISAVGIKELRGRMRGRRAFAVVTIYLALLSLLAFAVYYFMKQQALINGTNINDPTFGGIRDGIPFPGGQVTIGGTALSAAIGHAMFGTLLAIETLLVMVLAPAFTSGAISLEREKQTLDLLVTTPLSTLGMVVGKLISALSYVFLLIIASIPLASLVFVFGAVGPEDLVRGYLALFALAFGMGALGLFISALVKRTQTATVLTYVLVLVLSIGTVAVHQFWIVAARRTQSSSLVVTTRPFAAPEALLWLNPFVADADLICTTAPGADRLCEYMSQVTGKPYFGSTSTSNGTTDVLGAGGVAVGQFPIACPPNAKCIPPDVQTTVSTLSLGFPRDTFWPKSSAAFGVLGIVLTLLSAQLVSPTRRLRLRRPRFGGLRRRSSQTSPAPTEAAPDASTDIGTSIEIDNPTTETPA